jgi:hypothetical protein
MFEGSGFQLSINGTLQRVGFYASRIIDASSDGQIDTNCLLESLYGDLHKSEVIRTTTSEVSVSEVKPLHDGVPAPSSGFTFFVDDK